MAASWAGNDAKTLSGDLLAIFDDNIVPARFRENGFVTRTDLAASCNEEKDIKEDLLRATECTDIGFQEKKDIRKAWMAARGRLANPGTSSWSVPASAPTRKMPYGAENRLRTVWKAAHGIHPFGAWLTTEPAMTHIYIYIYLFIYLFIYLVIV